MKKIFERAILIFLSIPGNSLKDAVRNIFYGEVVSERIFEYAAVFRNLNIKPGKKIKILDVGCYYSNLPLQLASLGYSVTAIDLQNYELTHPNLNFILGDITKHDFEGQKFNFVTCVSTLEHIGLGVYGGNLEARADRIAVEAMHKVLKKGGRLILTFPYGKSATTETYRSYSSRDIAPLLKDFLIEDISFYKKIEGKWFKTTRNEMITLNNKNEVRGVSVIIAKSE